MHPFCTLSEVVQGNLGLRNCTSLWWPVNVVMGVVGPGSGNVGPLIILSHCIVHG